MDEEAHDPFHPKIMYQRPKTGLEQVVQPKPKSGPNQNQSEIKLSATVISQSFGSQDDSFVIIGQNRQFTKTWLI
jgi:hypothetical protein